AKRVPGAWSQPFLIRVHSVHSWRFPLQPLIYFPLQASCMTRRQALQAAAFTVLPARLVRGYSANSKLNIGVIGLAGMGNVDARTFNTLGENIAALCDVDSKVLEKRAKDYPK